MSKWRLKPIKLISVSEGVWQVSLLDSGLPLLAPVFSMCRSVNNVLLTVCKVVLNVHLLLSNNLCGKIHHRTEHHVWRMYWAAQNLPVTSQAVYRNSSKLRISLQLAVSSVLMYFKNSFSVPTTDVWWATTAIRQNDINLLVLDWT